jgi:hypothetical protein
LKRKLVTAEHVHGKTGLDGIELFEPARPLERCMRSISSSKRCAGNRPAQSRFARSARSPTSPRHRTRAGHR